MKIIQDVAGSTRILMAWNGDMVMQVQAMDHLQIILQAQVKVNKLTRKKLLIFHANLLNKIMLIFLF